MDLDVCAAAGDGARRKLDLSAVAEGTMEVVPLEMYDSARAKIDANLRWLFAKAYGIDHIPPDLRDPFYTDQYEQEHIKPPVIRLLLSCELYCRVCALILKTEQAAALHSHLCVIQALSRKGLYVVESDDTPVTHDDLSSLPIKMSAHMPMIDALMMAYTVEMISIEKVVASVKRFSTFSASKELPFDLEDAMVFWINKVNMKLREYAEREHRVKQHPLESPSHQKVRYRREHASGRQQSFFPVMEDLMKDVSDGAALLAVVHYYCPDVMKLEDICLKEVTSIADSLYNIQLLKEFASEYLNKSFYLSTEDVLYSPLVLKHNVMVFIAELFWWFETVKPEFVQPKHLQDFKDAQAMSQPKCSRPTVPISNATKRSFLASPGMAESQSNPEACNRYFLHAEESDPMKGSASFSAAHPLLPLRQRQQKHPEETAGLRNRSNSLTQAEAQPRGSVIAWPDKRQRPMSTLNPYVMHSLADGDADLASSDSVSLARSISKDSLASNVVNVTPKHQAPPPGLHPQPAAPRPRLNGHSLLGNVNMEDEEDALLAVARTDVSVAPQRLDATPAAAAAPAAVTPTPPPPEPEATVDGFYLEPLMPAVLRPAKEKSVCLNKEDESGEGPRPSGRGSLRHGDAPSSAVRRKAPSGLSRTPTPASAEEADLSAEPPQTCGGGGAEPEPTGFFLHSESDEPEQEMQELEEDEEELDEALTTKDPHWQRKALDDEEESAKLREDMNVKEHVDKEDKEAGGGGSGHSSPCLSNHSSQASSLASSSVRMTSFAERKAHQQQRFGSNHDLRSSASSSQRTTPDGSDVELLQLHMQLEEKRRAIEHQKKKMEVFSARQRQKLGKAAFLNIVKKGGGGGGGGAGAGAGGRSDTLPNPLKAENSKEELNGEKEIASKDDLCVGALRGEKATEASAPQGALDPDNKGSSGSFHLEEELDLNECNRSIELLNDAIGSIQQQMMQLSFQQEMLMKQNVQSPPGASLPPPTAVTADKFADPKVRAAVHFVEPLSAAGPAPPVRKPPKLSSARGSRSKPSELKITKDQSRQTSRAPGRSPRAERPESPRTPTNLEAMDKPGAGHHRSATFRLHNEDNLRLPTRLSVLAAAEEASLLDQGPSSGPRQQEAELNSSSDGSGKENAPSSGDLQHSKGHLIEVDLSDLGDAEVGQHDSTADGSEKSGLGFFFKDQQKAEDELAKKRAAFLLKQQKKAEEARLRKFQLEAESELKRDEARRKADEDQRRKEDEKARRELIKQEYLRRKQQEVLEEQGLVRPKLPKTPKTPKQKHRPKAVFRDEPAGDKGAASNPDKSGSSLSLASAATTTTEVRQRQLWRRGLPTLFKEPSAKSNKPIIHNAISHCCLAGKVNEPQKNQILEELEKCDSNHLMILFRDGGCQFRSIYSYFPDTEEIVKLTGTGPRSIGRKMIDKLYKYSSDRKQFTVIPAKTVSVSVDALTIHNHLWQAKRGAVPKKSSK
ncbi:LOW QUALITY PROTEIN: hypothetical protein CRUP_000995 [Coryphaenoides rupestris]|nr:LOW QUALITY PROTEIN: hypothetical protein CRUP_000995 [Coryphaenoides rupestris]